MPANMGKIYRDNFKPVSFELVDSNGESRVITQQKMLLPEVSNQIEELLKDDTKLTGDKMIEVMITYFGETEDFWSQISITLMTQILEDFNASQKKR